MLSQSLMWPPPKPTRLSNHTQKNTTISSSTMFLIGYGIGR